jgi:hypothetical protein
MKTVNTLLLALGFLAIGSAAQAGQASIYFRQNGLPVSSIAPDTSYVILGSVSSAKNSWVALCVQLTADAYNCINVLTNDRGFYAASSKQDSSTVCDSTVDSPVCTTYNCNFEISSVDLGSCDYTPRSLQFSIWKLGAGTPGDRILATGDLDIGY